MVAQLIVVLFSPILTRLYTPEEIGVYSAILAITSILIPLSSGRYEFLIVTAKNEKEALEFTYISVLFCLIFTSLLVIILNILELLNFNFLEELTMYKWIYIPIVVLGGFNVIFTQYNNRLSQYKKMSQITLFRSTVQIGSQTIFGLLSMGTGGLILSIIFSSFSGLNKQIKISIGNLKKLFKIDKSNIKKHIILNSNQLKISLPAAMLTTISSNLLIPLITIQFNAYSAGLFYIASRILAMPLQTFGSSLSKIFYKNGTKEYENYRKINKSFSEIVGISILFLTPICLVVYFASSTFIYIFGEKWGEVSIIIKTILPYFWIRGIVLSIIMTPYIFKKQKLDLINQMIILSALLISSVTSVYFNMNLYEFLETYNFIGFSSYLCVLILCFIYSLPKKGEKDVV